MGATPSDVPIYLFDRNHYNDLMHTSVHIEIVCLVI